MQPWTIGLRNRTCGDPSATMDFPLMGGPLGAGGSLFLHEYGLSDNGAPRASAGLVYAESGNIVVGEGDNRFHCTQVVMDVAAPDGTIGFRFFPREQPNDAASEFDTGLYTVVHNGLMDVRFSGRSVRMRLEALTDTPFAIGKTRLQMKQGGTR